MGFGVVRGCREESESLSSERTPAGAFFRIDADGGGGSRVVRRVRVGFRRDFDGMRGEDVWEGSIRVIERR